MKSHEERARELSMRLMQRDGKAFDKIIDALKAVEDEAYARGRGEMSELVTALRNECEAAGEMRASIVQVLRGSLFAGLQVGKREFADNVNAYDAARAARMKLEGGE